MFGINFKLIRLIVPKIMVARHDVQQSDPKNGTGFLLLFFDVRNPKNHRIVIKSRVRIKKIDRDLHLLS